MPLLTPPRAYAFRLIATPLRIAAAATALRCQCSDDITPPLLRHAMPLPHMLRHAATFIFMLPLIDRIFMPPFSDITLLRTPLDDAAASR